MVDVTTSIADTPWQPNLLRLSTPHVPKGTFPSTLTDQPDFGMGVVDTTAFIPDTPWQPSHLKRSRISVSKITCPRTLAGQSDCGMGIIDTTAFTPDIQLSLTLLSGSI